LAKGSGRIYDRTSLFPEDQPTIVTNASSIPLTGHWSPLSPFRPCPDRFIPVALVTDGSSKRHSRCASV
jgi:hypothetical protein